MIRMMVTKFGNKLASTIMNNVIRGAMKAVDTGNKSISSFLRRKAYISNQLAYLSKTVSYNHDMLKCLAKRLGKRDWLIVIYRNIRLSSKRNR